MKTTTSSGHWDAIEVRRHRIWLYDPPVIHPQGFGVMYLHDVDGDTLRERSEFTRLFDKHRITCGRPRSWAHLVAGPGGPGL